MSSWLTFVIGVILGLLLGWLIDLLYRRRASTTSEPEPIESRAVAVEPAALEPPPAPEVAREIEIPVGTEAPAVVEIPATPEPSAEVELPAPPEPPFVPETPAAAAAATAAVISEPPAPDEVGQEPEWPVMSERVGEVALDVETSPEAAPHIADELPAPPEGLPPEAVEALAPPAAAAEMPQRAAVPIDAHDKLIIIEGIGPAYDARLRAAGINTFRQLADTNPERLREIIQPQSWQRVNFDEWIEQARLAAEGRNEELKAFQARLFSRKKG